MHSSLRPISANVSVPRLELVVAHTLAKLLSHVNRALSSLDILRENQLWSDSLTVLRNWGRGMKTIYDVGTSPGITYLYIKIPAIWVLVESHHGS
jgi:hypothetical protein